MVAAMNGASVPPATSGAYPVRDGCALEPLVDGRVAFDRICEAIETAESSVWGTIAFLNHGAPMPGERGDLFDVLDAAVDRGVDVRVVAWRSDASDDEEHFPGTERQRRWLAERGTQIAIRWDSLPGRDCHHQKSWVIDVGSSEPVAFIGGINVEHASVVAEPGHPPTPFGNVHDVYAELRGPATVDAHHNFVQRWNGASERDDADGSWPPGGLGDLPFPDTVPAEVGATTVQLSRTIQPGRYVDSTPSPGADPHDIAAGEFSIYEQYIDAIDAARRTIYLEDQVIGSPKVIGHLLMALERGVRVVFVVPGDSHPEYAIARRNSELDTYFAQMADVDRFDSFVLVALARRLPDGGYDEIYVHSKLMIVDDEWVTIGSTNTATQSFKRDTELNVSAWDPRVASGLRARLFAEHLGSDVPGGEIAAFELFAEVAAANADRHSRGEELVGLAYALDAHSYGLGEPKRWPVFDPWPT